MSSITPSPPAPQGGDAASAAALNAPLGFGSRLLFILAGANPEIARQCPPGDQAKLRYLGFTTPIPAIVGMISIGWYSANQTGSILGGLAIGLLWGAIVIAIDLAMIATYSPLDPFLSRLGKILARLGLAFIIGLVISHPLMLWNFRDAIKDRYMGGQEAELRRLEKKRAELLEPLRDDHQKRIEEVNNQILDADKKIASVQASLTQQIELATAGTGKGIEDELTKIKEEIKENETRQTQLRAEVTTAEKDLADARLWLNQEGQFGLNVRDDKINPSIEEERNSVKPRSRGFAFSLPPADLNQEAPAIWKQKCPKMTTFWEMAQGANGRKLTAESALKRASDALATLRQQEAASAAILRTTRKDAADRAADSVKQAVDTEVASLKSRKEPLLQKRQDLMSEDTRIAEAREVAPYTSRIDNITRRLEGIRNGTVPIDTLQQTQSLLDEVFEPVRPGEETLGGSPASSSRILAGVFEMSKFFAIFMILDLIPILIKIFKGPTEYDEMVEELRPARRRRVARAAEASPPRVVAPGLVNGHGPAAPPPPPPPQPRVRQGDF